MEPGIESARDATAFANLTLSPALWAAVAKEPPQLPSVDDDDNVDDEMMDMWIFGWIVWGDDRRKRLLPKSNRGFARAKSLQRDVRAALSAIVRGDPAPVARQFNRCGPFRCSLSRQEVQRPRQASAPTALGWHVTWASIRASAPDDFVMHHLLTTLRFADRLGHCEQCKRFFLSARRWKCVPRVCSNRCSVAFQNARRLADGYFTRRRRQQRADAAREG
jgi:hypothetical protein